LVSIVSGCLSLLLFVAAAAVLLRFGGTVGMVCSGAVLLLALGRGWALFREVRRLRALGLADVDEMDGSQFEEHVAALLERQGYRVELNGASGDLGVDLIAQRGEERIAVQVKRQSRPVSRRAVSDAVAGTAHYGCTASMVVTNHYFTAGAAELAASTGCELVDRDLLAEWG
jgi:restriction system protein